LVTATGLARAGLVTATGLARAGLVRATGLARAGPATATGPRAGTGSPTPADPGRATTRLRAGTPARTRAVRRDHGGVRPWRRSRRGLAGRAVDRHTGRPCRLSALAGDGRVGGNLPGAAPGALGRPAACRGVRRGHRPHAARRLVQRSGPGRTGRQAGLRPEH